MFFSEHFFPSQQESGEEKAERRRSGGHRRASPLLPPTSISVTWRSFSGVVLNHTDPSPEILQEGSDWCQRGRDWPRRLVDCGTSEAPASCSPSRVLTAPWFRLNLVESSLETGTGIRFLYSLRFTPPQTHLHIRAHVSSRFYNLSFSMAVRFYTGMLSSSKRGRKSSWHVTDTNKLFIWK